MGAAERCRIRHSKMLRAARATFATGLLRRVFAPETLRKHHKLTSELRCFSNTVVYYHVHHIDC